MKRHKTDYPGVFFREARRIGGRGTERVYYIVFKKNGKLFEEKVGRQHSDKMTPAKASGIRSERIEGRRPSRKEIRKAAQAEKDAEANRWTVSRLWEEYKRHKPDLKGLATDEGRFDKYLKPAFGKKEPAQVILLDVDRLRLRIQKKLAPQTVKHVMVLLSRIINFGAHRGLCGRLPFRIPKPRVDNIRTEDLNDEQLASLLKAIDADDDVQAGNLMKMILYTGLRRGELFRLQWEDVDFERNFIQIRDPKGGKSQTIPLNETAKELLREHPRPFKDSPFVFPGRYGGQRKDIKRAVNRIKEAAGLPADFRPLHGLRHVYASMLASSGQVDMYTLQRLLTHKDPRTTQRYSHLRDEALRNASNLAGSIVVGIVEQAAKEQEEKEKNGR